MLQQHQERKTAERKRTDGRPSKFTKHHTDGWAARCWLSSPPLREHGAYRWKSLGERREGPSPVAAPAGAVELPCPFGG
eukprot:2147947-Karenia_brevis.AAC.1